MKRSDCKNPVQIAIDAVGGRKALASKLNPPCTRQAIEQWLKAAEIPLKRVPQVSAVTGIPKGELNPVFRD